MLGWACLSHRLEAGFLFLHSHPRTPRLCRAPLRACTYFRSRQQTERFINGVRLYPLWERAGMTGTRVKGHGEVELARLGDWVTCLRWVEQESKGKDKA